MESQTSNTSILPPHMGMLFESMDEAATYYENYDKEKGFWTRIRDTKRDKPRSNEITSVKIVCCRAGKHISTITERVYMEGKGRFKDGGPLNENIGTTKNRTSSTLMIDCKAFMRVKEVKHNAGWIVAGFCDDHNHKMVTPCKRHKMQSFRNMSKAVKNLAEAFHMENLPVGKLPALFGGEHSGFDSRDCWNHMAKFRHKELESGDAQSILQYFRKKVEENPQFYYAIQCDDDGRAVNFFWVDGRSRNGYHSFGDVVTFDTTYRTNKYNMPFAPFTGVNHHYQSICFGCALLQDESEDTFLWIFDAWLAAMGGRHPMSIITDQDLAMKSAIAKIFSNTRHRLCIWHIKKKFAEKLSHVYFQKLEFKKQMKTCIHWTYTEQDFESQWQGLMARYNLQENEWLQHLYEIRASWVPVYNRTTFFAGMNTTGRSEGMNSFFDDFVTTKTNLREFVIRFDRALKRIVHNEMNKDFDTEHKERVVEKGNFLLAYAAKVYTKRIYVKFANEWAQVYKFKIEEETHTPEWHYYVVKTKELVDGYKQHFQVQLNPVTHIGTCECKSFEFMGLICCHIMKVFSCLDVDWIPEPFIFGRWKKGANRVWRYEKAQLVRDDDNEHVEALRLNHMCQEMQRLACRAASYNSSYTQFIEGVHDLSIKIDETITSEEAKLIGEGFSGAASCGYGIASSQAQPDDATQLDVSELNPSQFNILDPKLSQTKGHKKVARGKEVASTSSRIKSGIEMATKGRKRLCRSCQKFVSHDSRNCPLNPNSKRRKQLTISEDDYAEEEDMDCTGDDDDDGFIAG